MAKVDMSFKIMGLEELRRRFEPRGLLGPALKDFLERVATTIENKVREETPTASGRLRAGIVHQISSDPVPLWARVGSKVKYAPYVEFGTKPHWPPPNKIRFWPALMTPILDVGPPVRSPSWFRRSAA